MPIGPGKYDELCTYVREQAKAEGAIVIILGGEQGMGFSMQAPAAAQLALPEMLEWVAGEIRSSLKEGKL